MSQWKTAQPTAAYSGIELKLEKPPELAERPVLSTKEMLCLKWLVISDFRSSKKTYLVLMTPTTSTK
ncbi:hypothetical protein Y032_0573g154 [Ancylostoma ceylanicum]|uniref:Uncharacterized protein n=1 Tax=Ancylostoma ceylanicum TaxID=53326 RepID=A0A016WNZ0_9BILA|nr:hypothetical protein Y032_0573g154 [Ancylostoma ceylanicum]